MKIFRQFLLALLAVLTSCQSAPKHHVAFSNPEELQSYLSWSAQKTPLIGAHRGGPEAGFPENCIATFENALEYAPCLLEMDIRKSKDSVLVLMHDETLDRTTDGSGRVDEHPWEQLKELRLQDPLGRTTDCRIPTLAEVLEWGREKAILQLDVKPGILPEEIVEIIAEHKAEAHCLVIAYTLETAQEYHRLNPRLMISAPAQGMEASRRLLESGINPKNLLGFVGVYEPPQEVYDLLHRQGIRAILGTIGNLDRKAETGGVEVYLELLKNGADVLATDNVSLAAQAIEIFEEKQNEAQTIEQLSRQVGEIIFGTVFLLVGLTAAGIAVIRRGKGVRILVGLAMWSAMYGARLLILTPAVRVNLPPLFQHYIPYIDVTCSYLILVFALLAWLDLTRGKMRLYIQTMIFAGLGTGLAGIAWFIATGAANTFMLYNGLLAAATLIILLIVVTVRKLSDKFLVLPNRGVLAVGTLLFAAEALYSNLSHLFGYRTWPILGWLGFAVLLFSLAYAAAKMIFASERRLLAIENELETARQIQSSILPATVPELNDLCIVPAYHPMTAVAGDFYDFIRIDSRRAGFLVADVSGHGVPAALIASMIKVAIQSVADSADDPGEVMRRLGNILGNQLRGQFVTAAYLYIDSANCRARYSAAGHPPLLYWDSAARQVRLIESNGLLIGFSKEKDYPVREIAFKSGDRFLLYTDGLTEAENSGGEAFGDRRLQEVIRLYENASAAELNANLLTELRLWQNAPLSQQDDITWIIVDSC